MKTNQSTVMLIVEDSDEDYYATTRAFKSAGVANNLYRCINGEEALDYLYQRGSYNNKNAPRPNLILLDLNMPTVSGKEVLKNLKSNPDLEKIPVIIFTTSSDEMDIDQCYDLGANSYIHKPVSLENFIESIKRLKEYWFEIVILPKTSE